MEFSFSLSEAYIKLVTVINTAIISPTIHGTAMNNPTYTAERNPIIPVQINVFSPYHTVGSAEGKNYDYRM